MNVGGRAFRTIWEGGDGRTVEIIDQTRLPHEFVTVGLRTLDDAVHAIRSMQVRGAPLIGVTAAYGVCLALSVDESDDALNTAYDGLLASRPTAINLRWALETMRRVLSGPALDDRVAVAYETAAKIADDDVASCRAIGEHGAHLFAELARGKEEQKGTEPLNILTHCNAGWLATVDWGTALAPIYMAHDLGIAVHVWVDETRPRNQGALTSWEPGSHGITASQVLDQPLSQPLALIDLNGCDEPGPGQPGDVVAGSADIAAGQEGLKVCSLGVVAQRGFYGLNERGLASSSGTVNEKQNLFTDISGQGVADGALEKTQKVGVGIGHLSEEVIPGREGCVRIVSDGAAPGQEIGAVVWPQLAGLQVQGAILDVQQPRAVIQVIG